jgi:class 3 adenylate cyclase
LRTYHECVTDTVTAFGGHVAQYQGDGLLAYFGYPRAHEDAAERAVRAGLATLEAMVASNSELERRHGVRLSLRIGIHTGPVVVAETGVEGRREVLAMGETVRARQRRDQR